MIPLAIRYYDFKNKASNYLVSIMILIKLLKKHKKATDILSKYNKIAHLRTGLMCV